MKRLVQHNNWRRMLLYVVSICAVWLLSGLPGWGFTHVTVATKATTRTFNVAMVLVDSPVTIGNNTSVTYWNADPWLLPVLNHSPLKPAGWVLANPLASGALANPVDPDLNASAAAYSNVVNWYTNGKVPGAALSKDDPAYWVVKLSNANVAALAKFDLLILDGHYQVNLTTADRENIKYLLDHGATIWINNSQRQGGNVNNLYPPIVFQQDTTDAVPYSDQSTTHLLRADPTNWLLNSYYQLTDQEVDSLHDCMSKYDYISGGVVGYADSTLNGSINTTALVQSVVNLRDYDNNGNFVQQNNYNINGDPAIAAGRFGNGLVVASAVDLIGATSDWWTNWHLYQVANNQTPWSLDVWPYWRAATFSTTNSVQKPNIHDRYIACSKLIFNMLDRQPQWNMAGGNALATRAVAQSVPTPLMRGWTTDFTTIGDPVTQDNYLAVTGYATSYGPQGANNNGSFDPTAAGELRVYRLHRVTDDTGTVLDYPFGLYTQDNYYLNPGRLGAPSWWTANYNTPATGITWQPNATYNATTGDLVTHLGTLFICNHSHTSTQGGQQGDEPGVGVHWTSYWDPYTYYPKDAPGSSTMDWCFSAPVPAGGNWVGMPIFSKVAMPDNNGRPISCTVLYALQRFTENNVTYYRPRCYLIDPYDANAQMLNGNLFIKDYGRCVGQVGIDLWTGRSDLLISAATNGLPGASMTLSHNRLIITTFGKTQGSSPRIYMLDATQFNASSPIVRVTIGVDPQQSTGFRLSGPAGSVTAQVDFEATGIEAGENSGQITSATYNPNAPEQRRDGVDMLAVSGEYFPPTASSETQIGQSALFLIPPTLSVPVPPMLGGLSSVPPGLSLTSNGVTTIIGDPNGNQFRKDYILSIKAGGNSLKITFNSWDPFFTTCDNVPPLSLPLQVNFPSNQNSFVWRPGMSTTSATQTVWVNQMTMGYPVLLQGSQIFTANGGATLHPNDGDGISTFGYLVDAPPLIYNNAALLGSNTYLNPAALPSLTNTQDTYGPRSMFIGGALNAVHLTDAGFSAPAAPMTYPYYGDVAWQFRGDTLGPKDTPATLHNLSGLNQFLWRSDFPFPAAAGANTVFTVGKYSGFGDYLQNSNIDFTTQVNTLVNNNTLTFAATIPPAQPRAMLYALDPAPSPYLQQVVTVGATAAPAALGYQDPQSQVTFYGSITNTYYVKIDNQLDQLTGNNKYDWSTDGTTWTGPSTITNNAKLSMDGTVFVAFPNASGYTPGATWMINPSMTSTDPHAGLQMRQLLVPAVVKDALTPGKRALLRIGDSPTTDSTWDLGAIVSVRQDNVTPGSYWVTFDRDRPTDAELLLPLNGETGHPNLYLMVATSVPYVSHVRGWNAITGEEPVRQYLGPNGLTTRLSAGIAPTPPVTPLLAGDYTPLAANPMLNNANYPAMEQSTMLEFLSQNPNEPTPLYTCHEVDNLTNNTAIPADDRGLFTDPTSLKNWQNQPHLFLPHVPTQSTSNPVTNAPGLNYTVDFLTGRIMLSPQAAGEFADRFLVVYYYTNEYTDILNTGSVEKKVFHAEVMHVPSQVKWQYQFADALPDSGPVLVNDTVYVTANRRVGASWQPVVYAFAANPAFPSNVQPLWMQPLPQVWNVPENFVNDTTTPYRWVTSPTPTANGILVGTEYPWYAPLWQPGQAYALNDTVAGSDGIVYKYIFNGQTTPDTSADTQPSVGSNWKTYWTPAANELTNFTAQNLYIADGSRVLSTNAGGVVNHQTLATQDYDPAAVDFGDPTIATTALVQQDFTLITRLRQLPNGDTLVCDTGANRVVQFDPTGTVTWQYPDSDLTYQDPDQLYTATSTSPARGASLPSIHIPTPAPLRLNDPRDVRRYTRDVTDFVNVATATRDANGNVMLTTSFSTNMQLPISIPTQLNITVQGVRTTTPGSNFNGQFTATATAMGPGSLTLTYTQTGQPVDAALPNAGIVDTGVLLQVPVSWTLSANPLTANIRWESTLIADAGNNRILEVDRPLLRFIDPSTGGDLQQLPGSIMLARGYQYRPDVTYQAPNGTTITCKQIIEVVADMNTLALGNTLLGKPVMFTAALRYGGPDNSIINAQLDPDPVMAGVRSSELLAVVGNTLHDPYAPNTFVRTVHLSRQLNPPNEMTAMTATTSASATPPVYSLFTTPLAQAVTAGSTLLTVADASMITIASTITVSDGTNTDTVGVSKLQGNIVTLSQPLQHAYAQTATVKYPEPALLVEHPDAPTLNALITTSAVTQTATAGNTIQVANPSKFYLGETVGIATGGGSIYAPPAQSQLLGTITNIIGNLITVQQPLTGTYASTTDPTRTSVLFALNQEGYEFARVRQLDLVTLQNPTEVHALVVDQAGVREVAITPAEQGFQYFAMTPKQYAIALQDGYWNSVIGQDFPLASYNQATTLQQILDGWRQVLTTTTPNPVVFSPVSVLRREPRPRGSSDDPTLYQQQVQYLIGQMNSTFTPWYGDLVLPRTFLFAARWVGGADNFWGIVDSDGNYFVYPDPLSPGFPNLPGPAYPLNEPLAIDQDQAQ